jgi:hypothetical protein
MLDLAFRTLGFAALVVILYLLVLLFLFRDEIRRTIDLRNKYGYTWCTAWNIALTESALDRRIRQAKQARKQS